MNQSPSGNDNPLLLALLSMLVGNGNAGTKGSNDVHAAEMVSKLLGQSKGSQPSVSNSSLGMQLLTMAQTTASTASTTSSTSSGNDGNGNNNSSSAYGSMNADSGTNKHDSVSSNVSSASSSNNHLLQVNGSQPWQPNAGPQQGDPPRPTQSNELSVALANAASMLIAPGVGSGSAAAVAAAAAANSFSNSRKGHIKTSSSSSNSLASKTSVPAIAAARKTMENDGRTNNARKSQEQSQNNEPSSKGMVIPCHARGMTMHHNFRTAYFQVPDSVEHGYDLVCSYADCRNRGVKFRWCSTCVAPVASRSFRQKHTHPAQSSSSESEETEATGKKSDQAVAYAVGSASGGSRLSTSSDCGSDSSEPSTSASSRSSDNDKQGETPNVALDTDDPNLPVMPENPAAVAESIEDESNPWNSFQARRNWMDLLRQRPVDSDPEAVSAWLGRVMATCAHQQMVSEESSGIPSDGTNSHRPNGRARGQNTSSSSSDDTAGSEDLKDGNWGGSETSGGGDPEEERSMEKEVEEEGTVVSDKTNITIGKQQGKRDLIQLRVQDAASSTAQQQASGTTTPRNEAQKEEPVTKRTRRD